MITDRELDTLLTAHREDQQISQEALAVARVRVLAAAEVAESSEVRVQPPRRRSRTWTRVLLAAATVVLLVAGGLLIPRLLTRGASPAAVELLERVAAQPHKDPVPGPGQYLLITTHAWYMSFDQTQKADGSPDLGTSTLRESYLRVWQPADYSAEWMMTSDSTGNARTLDGRSVKVPASSETQRARCGGFYDSDPCDRQGSWQTPTPAFMAGLPRDPDALFDRLEDDAPDNSHGAAELLVYAADMLRSGQVPADLRSALYLALRQVPGLEVTEQMAALDGRVGFALGIVDPSGLFRQDIIIDPDTGATIGEREVFLQATDGVPAGTTRTLTSVTFAVVDHLGQLSGS